MRNGRGLLPPPLACWESVVDLVTCTSRYVCLVDVSTYLRIRRRLPKGSADRQQQQQQQIDEIESFFTLRTYMRNGSRWGGDVALGAAAAGGDDPWWAGEEDGPEGDWTRKRRRRRRVWGGGGVGTRFRNMFDGFRRRRRRRRGGGGGLRASGGSGGEGW